MIDAIGRPDVRDGGGRMDIRRLVAPAERAGASIAPGHEGDA